ncbi:MAG: cyclic nucleotide-binding domain-containing protein [Ahrensia sp.]|nr:cyclic nucleotide-binding domain-containing protein [Ahrensia sp.]
MSKLKDEVELLRTIPVFSELPANKLKLLAFASDHMDYKDGEVLFEQGDVADSAYVVIKGGADVLVTPEGETQSNKVAELGPNSFIGDMAILADITRTATIRANAPLSTLRIRKDHLIDMMQDSPTFTMAVLRELVLRLKKTTSDLSDAQAEVARLKG